MCQRGFSQQSPIFLVQYHPNFSSSIHIYPYHAISIHIISIHVLFISPNLMGYLNEQQQPDISRLPWVFFLKSLGRSPPGREAPGSSWVRKSDGNAMVRRPWEIDQKPWETGGDGFREKLLIDGIWYMVYNIYIFYYICT